MADTITDILRAKNDPAFAVSLQEKRIRIEQIEKYDFQDDLIPEAWRKKTPPENIPVGATWLLHYFDTLGRELFSELWTGNEFYARSADQINADLTAFYEYKAKQDVKRGIAEADGKKYAPVRTILSGPKGYTIATENQQIFKTREEETNAFSNKKKVMEKIKHDLKNFQISGFLLDRNGKKTDIEREWCDIEKSIFKFSLDRDGQIYIDHIFQDRLADKSLQPPDCYNNDGIWIQGAIIAFAKKNHGMGYRSMKQIDLTRDIIRALQINPQINILTVSSYDGETKPFERSYLKSKTCTEYFMKGCIPYKYSGSQELSGDIIYLDKIQFENFLNDKQVSAQPAFHAPPADRYVPPYMEFMLKAVAELALSADNRVNKKAITGWLESNWPADLGEKSGRLIETMATLLRRPEDKKGGNTSWQPGKS